MENPTESEYSSTDNIPTVIQGIFRYMEIHASLIFSFAYIILKPPEAHYSVLPVSQIAFCFQPRSHHRHKTSLSLLGSSCLGHLSLTVSQACQSTCLKDPCPIIGTLKRTTGHILGR